MLPTEVLPGNVSLGDIIVQNPTYRFPICYKTSNSGYKRRGIPIELTGKIARVTSNRAGDRGCWSYLLLDEWPGMSNTISDSFPTKLEDKVYKLVKKKIASKARNKPPGSVEQRRLSTFPSLQKSHSVYISDVSGKPIISYMLETNSKTNCDGVIQTIFLWKNTPGRGRGNTRGQRNINYLRQHEIKNLGGQKCTIHFIYHDVIVVSNRIKLRADIEKVVIAGKPPCSGSSQQRNSSSSPESSPGLSPMSTPGSSPISTPRSTPNPSRDPSPDPSHMSSLGSSPRRSPSIGRSRSMSAVREQRVRGGRRSSSTTSLESVIDQSYGVHTISSSSTPSPSSSPIPPNNNNSHRGRGYGAHSISPSPTSSPSSSPIPQGLRSVVVFPPPKSKSRPRSRSRLSSTSQSRSHKGKGKGKGKSKKKEKKKEVKSSVVVPSTSLPSFSSSKTNKR